MPCVYTDFLLEDDFHMSKVTSVFLLNLVICHTPSSVSCVSGRVGTSPAGPELPGETEAARLTARESHEEQWVTRVW